MPQFDVSHFSSQLFWLVLAFGFLYIVVLKFIAPKAETILTSRNRYLEDNIIDSERYNEQARSLQESREQELEELRLESEKIRSAAIATLEELFAKKKGDLSEVLSNKAGELRLELQNYVKSFHSKESDSCIDLASFIIEKITDKPADMKLLKKICSEK